MFAYISHFRGDYENETDYRSWEFLCVFEALPDCIANFGVCYTVQRKYAEAIKVYSFAVDMIDRLFAENPYALPKHIRDTGNLYLLIAEAYLKNGEYDLSVSEIEKAVEYEINSRSKIGDSVKEKIRFLLTGLQNSYIEHTVP